MKYILIILLLGTNTAGKEVAKVRPLAAYTDKAECAENVSRHETAMRKVLDDNDWVADKGRVKIVGYNVVCFPVFHGRPMT